MENRQNNFLKLKIQKDSLVAMTKETIPIFLFSFYNYKMGKAMSSKLIIL